MFIVCRSCGVRISDQCLEEFYEYVLSSTCSSGNLPAKPNWKRTKSITPALIWTRKNGQIELVVLFRKPRTLFIQWTSEEPFSRRRYNFTTSPWVRRYYRNDHIFKWAREYGINLHRKRALFRNVQITIDVQMKWNVVLLSMWITDERTGTCLQTSRLRLARRVANTSVIVSIKNRVCLHTVNHQKPSL